MATADQLPKAPPLRFELTEEQVADLERSKPPGSVALVVGYAERHRWRAGSWQRGVGKSDSLEKGNPPEQSRIKYETLKSEASSFVLLCRRS
jgi:hypothetical protein